MLAKSYQAPRAMSSWLNHAEEAIEYTPSSATSSKFSRMSEYLGKLVAAILSYILGLVEMDLLKVVAVPRHIHLCGPRPSRLT